jgi:superfamily II DNA or RNA helicase
MNHPRRNKVIQRICELAVGNILVLVDRVQYGENLLALMQGGTKKVFFVQGSMDTDDRMVIKKIMEEENGIICIAMSTIFSTGVSINNLHSAIFAYIGKSNVKIIQSIGRTLRKHESKEKAVIYDIADNLKYSADHFKARATHYQNQKIDIRVQKIDL